MRQLLLSVPDCCAAVCGYVPRATLEECGRRVTFLERELRHAHRDLQHQNQLRQKIEEHLHHVRQLQLQQTGVEAAVGTILERLAAVDTRLSEFMSARS